MRRIEPIWRSASVILQAAACPWINPARRSFSRELLARRLGAMPPETVGPGSIGRVVKELQRDHFTPPALAGHAAPRRLW